MGNATELANAGVKKPATEDTSIPEIATAETLKCHLLDMPPEMRNRVYQLVYPRSGTADFLDSDLLKRGQPLPDKALAMTCRQIYREARLVYCAIWDETEFLIDADDSSDNVGENRDYLIRRVRETGEWRLERVTRMRIAGVEGLEAVLKGGAWTFREAPMFLFEETTVLLFPECKAEAAEEAGFWPERFGSTPYKMLCVNEDEDAEAPARMQQAVGRRNLRKEELAAVVKMVYAPGLVKAYEWY